jgi:hypothetical protein
MITRTRQREMTDPIKEKLTLQSVRAEHRDG